MTVSTDVVPFNTLLQIAALTLAVIGMFALFRWMGLNTRSKAYAFAPLWYLAQVVIYYIVILFRPVPGSEVYAIASSVLRMEAIVILAASPFIMTIFVLRQKWKPPTG